MGRASLVFHNSLDLQEWDKLCGSGVLEQSIPTVPEHSWCPRVSFVSQSIPGVLEQNIPLIPEHSRCPRTFLYSQSIPGVPEHSQCPGAEHSWYPRAFPVSQTSLGEESQCYRSSPVHSLCEIPKGFSPPHAQEKLFWGFFGMGSREGGIINEFGAVAMGTCC